MRYSTVDHVTTLNHDNTIALIITIIIKARIVITAIAPKYT